MGAGAFFFPADSFTPGAYFAQDTRWPEVGNLVISVPISAMMTAAATSPMPVTSSSRSAALANGAIICSITASSSAISASMASTRASILASKNAWVIGKVPEGLDLDLSLIRLDMAEQDVATLECQLPGLAARLLPRSVATSALQAGAVIAPPVRYARSWTAGVGAPSFQSVELISAGAVC